MFKQCHRCRVEPVRYAGVADGAGFAAPRIVLRTIERISGCPRTRISPAHLTSHVNRGEVAVAAGPLAVPVAAGLETAPGAVPVAANGPVVVSVRHARTVLPAVAGPQGTIDFLAVAGVTIVGVEPATTVGRGGATALRCTIPVTCAARTARIGPSRRRSMRM